LRVTVGTPDENSAFLDALGEVLADRSTRLQLSLQTSSETSLETSQNGADQ
jgi:hypothetical protein